MELLAWKKEFETKVSKIDEQHRELVKYLNNLFDAMRVGKGKVVLNEILDGLAEYTVKHFAAEERLMVVYAYPDYTEHKEEHASLVKEVKEFQRKFTEGKSMITVELMNFLKSWLLNHIQGDDKKLGVFLQEKGVA